MAKLSSVDYCLVQIQTDTSWLDRIKFQHDSDHFGKLLSQNMIVHEKIFTVSPQKYAQEGKWRQEVQLRKKKEET